MLACLQENALLALFIEVGAPLMSLDCHYFANPIDPFVHPTLAYRGSMFLRLRLSF